MFKKLICGIKGHSFDGELQHTYQSLNSHGINYKCKCSRCGCVSVAEFGFGVDFSKIDKKLLSDYFNDRGFILKG